MSPLPERHLPDNAIVSGELRIHGKIEAKLFKLSKECHFCGVKSAGGNMHRTSERLRVVARAMPMSLPPLEGGLLIFLIVTWLFA